MGKRLMVVDDSRVVELQIRKLLEGTEFEVVGYCQDGETAIAKYVKIRPDVVTIDIIMPGIDGLETAQAILEDHPEARIVMVSSLAYEGSFREAEAIGAKGFVAKPFEQDELLQVLYQALKV